MKAYIKLEGNVTDDDSESLKELANLIRKDCDLSVEIEEKKPESGKKDGGLAIAIAIASLAVATIQTLISVFQYWQSKRPKYSLSITFYSSDQKETLLLETSSTQEIQEMISHLKSQSFPEYEYVEVQISKHQ